MGLSDNVKITNSSYYFFLITFLVLTLFTLINEKILKIVCLFCIVIISVFLYLEGLSNDMFGPLYPYFIGLFCCYYILLNYLSMKNKIMLSL